MTEDEKESAIIALLNEVAPRLAAIDDIEGMPMTVVVAYAMMDNEGEMFTGDAFSGSKATAIGLLEMTKHRLVNDEDEE